MELLDNAIEKDIKSAEIQQLIGILACIEYIKQELGIEFDEKKYNKIVKKLEDIRRKALKEKIQESKDWTSFFNFL